jgi:hypothetical protein
MIPRRFHPLANALAVLALIAPLLAATYLVRQTRHDAAVAVATVTREAAAEREVAEAVLAAYREQLRHVTAQRDKATAEVEAVREDNAALVKRLKRKPRVAVKRSAAKSRPAVKRYSGSIPALIRRIAKAHGYGSADTEALVTLCRRESTFRPTATNGSCKGLFQLKTSSSRWADPAWNTTAAIGYIEKRYGSPRKALAHSYSRGWY